MRPSNFFYKQWLLLQGLLKGQGHSQGARRRNTGLVFGFSLGVLALGMLIVPNQERLHALGPANTGHEDLACSECHVPAPGTVRQQIQAEVRYWLSLRKTPVDFGYQEVDNTRCLKCHERPNDRHPVFRFLEPRFAEVRAKLQPQFCVSCHQEHLGKRITLPETTYCVECHRETKIKDDPLTISHAALIEAENWASCLGCHDFHGNHVMETPVDVAKALPQAVIVEYFNGGNSPYPPELYYPATEPETQP